MILYRIKSMFSKTIPVYALVIHSYLVKGDVKENEKIYYDIITSL